MALLESEYKYVCDYPKIFGTTGMTKARITTKDKAMKTRLIFNVFFIVTCPGPKISGIGAQAAGVSVAIAEAIPIAIAIMPMCTEPPFSRATPMLKKIVIVTTLDKKFVMINAQMINTINTAIGLTFASNGCSTFVIHTLIPVSSDVIGVDMTQTTPAKMIAPIGSDFNAAGISRIGSPSIWITHNAPQARIAGTTTPQVFQYPATTGKI